MGEGRTGQQEVEAGQAGRGPARCVRTFQGLIAEGMSADSADMAPSQGTQPYGSRTRFCRIAHSTRSGGYDHVGL